MKKVFEDVINGMVVIGFFLALLWLCGCATFKANADLYDKKVQCEFPCWGGEIK